MAIIEKNAWTGLPISGVRPFARVRMGAQLETVAEDQAFAFRHLTGVSVPNAPGVSVAAPHIHDGTNGAIIPIPVAQQYLNARLVPASANGTTDVPVIRLPFFAPPGHATWRVELVTRNPAVLMDRLRIFVQNESLAVTAGGTYPRTYPIEAGLHVVYSDLTCTADAVNVLNVYTWDGARVPERDLLSFTLTPYVGDPYPSNSPPSSTYDETDVSVPTATQHLGAHAFTSMQTGMFTNDRAISSYVIQGMNKNEGYLFERLCDLPAGSRQTQTWEGHDHGGLTSTSTTSASVGALMDHSLGAWFYGVGRGPVGSTTHCDHDENAGKGWTGRIFAPTITSGTAAETVAEHHVRLPEAGVTGNYAHSSGKLNFAALVYNEQSKNTSMTITATMLDSTGGTAGSPQSATSNTSNDGWELLQITGLDASGSTDGIIEQTLRVDMSIASYSARSGCLYGVCLWFEA